MEKTMVSQQAFPSLLPSSHAPHVSLAPKTPFPFPFKHRPRRENNLSAKYCYYYYYYYYIINIIIPIVSLILLLDHRERVGGRGGLNERGQ